MAQFVIGTTSEGEEGAVWSYVESSAGSIVVNRWTHVVGVSDGNEMRLYINGMVVASLDISGRTFSVPTSNDCLIGEEPVYSGRRFAGRIDEVRIWNVARTEAQIQENMMKTLASGEQGLVAYYRMDLYDGTTLYDMTSNANNGTFVGLTSDNWVSSDAFNTWIGAENNSWTNSANWSNGVPSAAQGVGIYNWNPALPLVTNHLPALPATISTNSLLIPAGVADPENVNLTATGSVFLGSNITLDADALNTAANLVIVSGNTLTLPAASRLTVSSQLINNAGEAGVLIESTVNGTGSLVHNTPGVQATTGRHIAGTSGWGPGHPAVDWHMISSPVANQSISGDWTPVGEGNGYDFYAWDEGGQWLNQKIEANSITHFNPGKGYLVAYQQTGTKSFTGTLNTGTVTHTLVYSGPGGKDENGWDYVHGWNLIGNPFPSAINWNLVNRDTYFQDHYAYVWNREKDGGPGYTEIDGVQAVAHIPANQGFFVLVKDDQHGTAFSFNNDIRVHGPEFMKNNDTNAKRLIVRLAGETYFDQSTIRIEAGTDYERDRRDALKLLSFAPYVPQLYTFTSNNVMVAVNSIPKIQEDQQIRMGVLIPEDGEYTLSVQELGPIFSDRPIYLLDNATGIRHKLNETPEYVFNASAGTYNQRFWLSFGTDDDDSVNLTDPGLETEVHIWQHNNILHVVNPDTDINLHLYDISGRRLRHFNAPAGQHRFELNLPAGAYFVKSSGESQHEIIKIIIQ